MKKRTTEWNPYDHCTECAERYYRMADISWRSYQAVQKAKRNIATGHHPWPHVANRCGHGRNGNGLLGHVPVLQGCQLRLPE